MYLDDEYIEENDAKCIYPADFCIDKLRGNFIGIFNSVVIVYEREIYRMTEHKSNNNISVDNTIKDALKALSSLQSNTAYLKSACKQNAQNDSYKLRMIQKDLFRCGITPDHLDTLSVIHVAGTKGKGSTCAYIEAILRNHGFNTGFFSSPHLVSVRERIRINGKPISQVIFTRYFWEVYKRLEISKEDESDMPTYFSFLTILMFKIFLKYRVSVAIIEVGIGGEKDCTNIIKHPICVGITSLALDHTSLLGNTIEDIAYQKSGIFKPRVPAFTVPQSVEAMHVLEERAVEKQCTLNVVPLLTEEEQKSLLPAILKLNNVQKQNLSLAIQLANKWVLSTLDFRNSHWLDKKCQGNSQVDSFIQDANVINILSTERVAEALSSCKWPGRMQILKSRLADFFLDGAHTIESIECCVSWFGNTTCKVKGKKYLIFNTFGDRNSARFLKPLKSLNFHKVYFVPNYAGTKTADDEMNNCFPMEEEKIKCKKNSEIWGENSTVADSVSEVLQDLKENIMQDTDPNRNDKALVLVTGSLHLVGAVLTILDPDLTMTTDF